MEGDKKKILIVDDTTDLSEAMGSTLEREGFEVLVAGGGIDGLQMALKEHPDLIFLDIEMPDKSGKEVLDELRQDEWGKHVVIVIMTVLDDEVVIADMISRGANAYILKNDINLFEVVDLAKQHTA